MEHTSSVLRVLNHLHWIYVFGLTLAFTLLSGSLAAGTGWGFGTMNLWLIFMSPVVLIELLDLSYVRLAHLRTHATVLVLFAPLAYEFLRRDARWGSNTSDTRTARTAEDAAAAATAWSIGLGLLFAFECMQRIECCKVKATYGREGWAALLALTAALQAAGPWHTQMLNANDLAWGAGIVVPLYQFVLVVTVLGALLLYIVLMTCLTRKMKDVEADNTAADADHQRLLHMAPDAIFTFAEINWLLSFALMCQHVVDGSDGAAQWSDVGDAIGGTGVAAGAVLGLIKAAVRYHRVINGDALVHPFNCYNHGTCSSLPETA